MDNPDIQDILLPFLPVPLKAGMKGKKMSFLFEERN
jgi:hypothetical protein